MGRAFKSISAVGGVLLGLLFHASAADSLGRDADRGRELARTYCQTCHVFPEPSLLPKTTWMHHVLPDMAAWVGMERVDFAAHPDGHEWLAGNVFPAAPVMSEADWLEIWHYYEAAAPSQLTPPSPQPEFLPGLPNFRVHKRNFNAGVPTISLVQIDSAARRVFVGDAFANLLGTLEPFGATKPLLRLRSPPVSLFSTSAGRYVTTIGRLFPSDAREGEVLFMPQPQPAGEATTILRSLRRPTDLAVADLNHDGADDLVVCSYGHRLGKLSWYENDRNGGYLEHVLLDRPGSMQVDVRDYNEDGRPDILVLTGQAREGLYLFLNTGTNSFVLQTVVEYPPAYGSAHFEIADFNHDGKPDILTAHGDNGDYAGPLRPYHGLRIYMNAGRGRFSEAFFFHLDGAYKALARDFDQDGDLDIAAIAYYPDFERTPERGFVYLENKGGLRFEAHTIAEAGSGRWLVMDAGDFDGDGDTDIVLGSFVNGPTTRPVPEALREAWRTNGAALLLLENTRR